MYCSSNIIEGDDMGGIYIHERNKKCTHIICYKFQRKRLPGRGGVDWKIILTWILAVMV